MTSWIRKTKNALARRDDKPDNDKKAIQPASLINSMQDYQDQMLNDPYVFKHDPLDTSRFQIRLVQLWPSPDALGLRRPFHCTIEIFDAEVAPPYIALSYTWGPLVNTNPISLNGKRFSVRENLLSFLETFSFNPQCPHYYVWIDQICIDQTNNSERNHQVGLMSAIYENSAFVITWLGHDAQAAAMQLEAQPSEACIQALLDNVYFTRLWIVQEVLIGKAVFLVCGNMWVKWDHFRNTILALSETSFARLPTAKWLFHMKEERNYTINPRKWKQLHLSLYETMSRYASLSCENPRDKIYGLTSLVDQDKFPVPEIDYSKTLEEVYFEAMSIMLQAPQPLTQAQMVVAMQEIGPTIGLSKQFMKHLKPFLKDIEFISACTGGMEFQLGYEVSERGEPEWWFGVDDWVQKWWYDRTGRLSPEDPTKMISAFMF